MTFKPCVGLLTNVIGKVMLGVGIKEPYIVALTEQFVDRGNGCFAFANPGNRKVASFSGALTSKGRGLIAAKTSGKSNGICRGSLW